MWTSCGCLGDTAHYQIYHKGVLARHQARHNSHDSQTKENLQVKAGMIQVQNGKGIGQTADNNLHVLLFLHLIYCQISQI